MTVGQLIERLQQLPQTLPVVLNFGHNELANSREAGTVAVEDVVAVKYDREPTRFRLLFSDSPESEREWLEDNETLLTVVNLTP
jgi:hypothetical protein